ncbi:hypothetical protein GCM10010124_20010 [Pilimelia terevasa]|uniref:Extradiol ring-cleavage dioxygenase class III enzyme subunit B domain-containing protein n=1 Tax=Pilimelia terevasa TaxID=53372 RepID=A0A8J3BKE2_9ACTN|nr:hypothetical protein GCM10010124_20010 [Pilimelia terevasa]
MPVVSVAVCPHPPLLVPGVAGAAAGELTALRDACAEAVGVLRGCDRVVLVGGAPRTGWWPAAARPTLAPYGWESPLPSARVLAPPAPVDDDTLPLVDDGTLPLSLTVGAWLLGRSDPAARCHAAGVAPGGGAGAGRAIGALAGAVGLLVLGDGSACRGEKAPGYADPRAEAYDAHLAALLGGADTAGIAALDPELAAALLVAGHAPWQALAAAAPGPWQGTLHHHAAPYGVAYLVASWRPA